MPEETFRWVVAGGVAIAALSILAMAAVTIVLIRAVSKLQSRIDSVAEQTVPVVQSVRDLIGENGPKFGEIMNVAKEAATNTRDISALAKDQAYRFAEVGRDITDRAKVQVARVDAVVDDTVEQVHHLGNNVRTAVIRPVSEVSGVLAGIRAGLSAYAQGRRPSVARVTQDEEMFI
jgi:methyl-accepting chemotaxis protein